MPAQAKSTLHILRRTLARLFSQTPFRSYTQTEIEALVPKASRATTQAAVDQHILRFDPHLECYFYADSVIAKDVMIRLLPKAEESHRVAQHVSQPRQKVAHVTKALSKMQAVEIRTMPGRSRKKGYSLKQITVPWNIEQLPAHPVSADGSWNFALNTGFAGIYISGEQEGRVGPEVGVEEFRRI
jgi:hypothetical protein